MKTHNIFDVDTNAPVVREFRVVSIRRYAVTDWSDYRGGRVSTVADDLTLEQANKIAEALGRSNPGSLVNLMEPLEISYGLP